MSQADLGRHPPSNAPFPAQHDSSSGTSTFAVLVAFCFLLMTSFFVLSFWAVLKRSEGHANSSSPAVVENSGRMQSPSQSNSQIWLDATVNIKRRDRGPGQLRAAPDRSATPVAEFDHGTQVKVAESSIRHHDTWYRVKGIYKGEWVEGWMHSDILIVAISP